MEDPTSSKGIYRWFIWIFQTYRNTNVAFKNNRQHWKVIFDMQFQMAAFILAQRNGIHSCNCPTADIGPETLICNRNRSFWWMFMRKHLLQGTKQRTDVWIMKLGVRTACKSLVLDWLGLRQMASPGYRQLRLHIPRANTSFCFAKLLMVMSFGMIKRKKHSRKLT